MAWLHDGRRWNAAEDETLIRMSGGLTTLVAVAQTLGRSKHSVSSRARRLRISFSDFRAEKCSAGAKRMWERRHAVG